MSSLEAEPGPNFADMLTPVVWLMILEELRIPLWRAEWSPKVGINPYRSLPMAQILAVLP